MKAEAKASFGDDRIFIEKFIEQPRHEIQVMGDKHGTVSICSSANARSSAVTRKSSSLSPLLDEATRKRWGTAVALAKAVDSGHGGIRRFGCRQELLPGDEHPPAGRASGDRDDHGCRSGRADAGVAYGEKLAIKQEDLKINGWAVESRVYAEDPYRSPALHRAPAPLPPAGRR